jgi:hypothetical protein
MITRRNSLYHNLNRMERRESNLQELLPRITKELRRENSMRIRKQI